MKPVKFKEQNTTYAANQPDYFPLPAHRTKKGLVITCWRMSLKERLRILFTGRLWWAVHTVNRPLQPQLPLVKSPFIRVKEELK